MNVKRSVAIGGTVGALAIVLLTAGIAFALASTRGPVGGPAGSSGPSDRQPVPAPIDALDVRADAGRHVLAVRAGLPSGCAQRGGSPSVTREGDSFTVIVLNTVPVALTACTMIYGSY